MEERRNKRIGEWKSKKQKKGQRRSELGKREKRRHGEREWTAERGKKRRKGTRKKMATLPFWLLQKGCFALFLCPGKVCP